MTHCPSPLSILFPIPIYRRYEDAAYVLRSPGKQLGRNGQPPAVSHPFTSNCHCSTTWRRDYPPFPPCPIIASYLCGKPIGQTIISQGHLATDWTEFCVSSVRCVARKAGDGISSYRFPSGLQPPPDMRDVRTLSERELSISHPPPPPSCRCDARGLQNRETGLLDTCTIFRDLGMMQCLHGLPLSSPLHAISSAKLSRPNQQAFSVQTRCEAYTKQTNSIC
jgi:hypothetical protein